MNVVQVMLKVVFIADQVFSDRRCHTPWRRFLRRDSLTACSPPTPFPICAAKVRYSIPKHFQPWWVVSRLNFISKPIGLASTPELYMTISEQDVEAIAVMVGAILIDENCVTGCGGGQRASDVDVRHVPPLVEIRRPF
jgi:hypothetical protein